MKKQLLLFFMLFSLQCYSMSAPKQLDAKLVLMHLYERFKSTQVEDIDEHLAYQITDRVYRITQYAIENSKSIMGQDKNLIATANNIRQITDNIEPLYKIIRNNKNNIKGSNDMNDQLHLMVTRLAAALSNQLKQIQKYHITTSKQYAQKALQDTINFLINPILKDIEHRLQEYSQGLV